MPGGIGGMIASSEPAPAFPPGARYILRNLPEPPPEQLSRDPLPGSGMIVLIGRAPAYMQAIAEGLGPQAELQRRFADYISATCPDADLERLTQARQAILTEPLERSWSRLQKG